MSSSKRPPTPSGKDSQELLDLPLSGREDGPSYPEERHQEQSELGAAVPPEDPVATRSSPPASGGSRDPRNLDLFAAGVVREPDSRSPREAAQHESAPRDLFEGDALAESDPLIPAAQHRVEAPERVVTRFDRFLGGLLDLGVLGLIVTLGLLLSGADLDGLPTSAWMGPIGFLLVLSFVYLVISLAFWGRTPGMMVARLVAFDAGGDSLTGGQCVRRWLAAVLTAAFLGVPLVLTPGTRSLADRWSASLTARRQD